MNKYFNLLLSFILLISNLSMPTPAFATEEIPNTPTIYDKNFDREYTKYVNGDWINRIISLLESEESFSANQIDIHGDYDVTIYPNNDKTNIEEENERLFRIDMFTPLQDIRISVENTENNDQLMDYIFKLINIIDPEIEINDELIMKLEDVIYLESSEIIGDLNIGYSIRENTGYTDLTIVRDLSDEIELGEIEDLARTQPGEVAEYDEGTLAVKDAVNQFSNSIAADNAGKTDTYADYLEFSGEYVAVPYRYIIRDQSGYLDENLIIQGEITEILKDTQITIIEINVDENDPTAVVVGIVENSMIDDSSERPVTGDTIEVYGVGGGFEINWKNREVPTIYVFYIRDDNKYQN